MSPWMWIVVVLVVLVVAGVAFAAARRARRSGSVLAAGSTKKGTK